MRASESLGLLGLQRAAEACLGLRASSGLRLLRGAQGLSLRKALHKKRYPHKGFNRLRVCRVYSSGVFVCFKLLRV